MTAWRNHIAFPFGVCRKLLTDNGTEFKNDLFSRVAKELVLHYQGVCLPCKASSLSTDKGTQ